jgi:phosphohistidine swiveling domain-containing protein
VTTDSAGSRAAAEEALAKTRARVPQEHREQFEDLLREAQTTYRMRDERGFHTDALATGVARRALLAAGERLKARGKILDPSHLVDASSEEIIALLEGKPGPSASELAERVRWRLETPLSTAPAHLGFPPSPPPPADWLPPAAARLQRITALTMSLMFDVHPPPAVASTGFGGAVPKPPAGASTSLVAASAPPPLKGHPVSAGVYEGPARVIDNIEELASVQAGEVLVATSTGPTFNVVLPLIGALVTERGGVLSHAAIVSREYGLPGVVGCVGATKRVKTGMRVRVNGGTGEVWTL